MKIPVTDEQLRRFDAFTTRRPVAFIGFILLVVGFLLMVLPQRQVAPAIVFLAAGGVLDITVATGLLLLRSREKRARDQGA